MAWSLVAPPLRATIPIRCNSESACSSGSVADHNVRGAHSEESVAAPRADLSLSRFLDCNRPASGLVIALGVGEEGEAEPALLVTEHELAQRGGSRAVDHPRLHPLGGSGGGKPPLPPRVTCGGGRNLHGHGVQGGAGASYGTHPLGCRSVRHCRRGGRRHL